MADYDTHTKTHRVNNQALYLHTTTHVLCFHQALHHHLVTLIRTNPCLGGRQQQRRIPPFLHLSYLLLDCKGYITVELLSYFGFFVFLTSSCSLPSSLFTRTEDSALLSTSLGSIRDTHTGKKCSPALGLAGRYWEDGVGQTKRTLDGEQRAGRYTLHLH